MTKSGNFEIREVSIVLAAKSNNPSILNPDFLKYNDIVSRDWQTKGTPICIEPMAEVTFENDIKITSQYEKILFFEPIKKDEDKLELIIDKISQKYVETIPHVNYIGVGINPKGHIIFDSTEEARNYVLKNFIKLGSMGKYEQNLTDLGLNLSLKIDQTLLSLHITPSIFTVSDKDPIPVVLFSGNFHHQIGNSVKKERIKEIISIIKNWPNDIEFYKKLIFDLPMQ